MAEPAADPPRTQSPPPDYEISGRNDASSASRRAVRASRQGGGHFGRQLLAPRSGLYQLLHLRQSWNCVSVPPL